MKKLYLFLLASFIIHIGVCQEIRFTDNPDSVKFHTKDISTFWRIFESNDGAKGKIWKREYLDKGSVGLKAFIPYRIESGNKLSKTIKGNIEYYKSIKNSSLKIESKKDEFYNSFRNLKQLYPKAVFPDVYFVIGRKNSAGTAFNKGLIIGVERFGNMNNIVKPDIDIDLLDDVVAHELIHFQQNYVKDNSLLAQCIKEGAADFLGEMIAGSHLNKEVYMYGEKHLDDLWKEFMSLKDRNNLENWLYSSKDKSRPNDLGYWMGYKICESYYRQGKNKKQAIYDILNIDDFNQFLSKSGFKGKNKELNKLEIKINKNVELLGLGYFIGFEGVDIENKTVEIDDKIIPKKDWHNYGFKLYQEYKSFANSSNLAKCFSVADHLWLDYLTAFLLKVDDVPNAKLTDLVDENYYLNFSKEKDPFEAKKNAEIFLNGLNAFATEINFDSYLTSSQIYYDQVSEEIISGLPSKYLIAEMEAFYDKTFDRYLLIPSLTIPKGMGFGIRNFEMNETKIFNVFGALDFQKFDKKENLQMGFSNQKKLRELSVHEFGHSFVNPVVEQLPDSLLVQTEHLFKPIKSIMSDQGYNTWKVCVYEHFVRAGEIIIAERIGKKEDARKLFEDYKQERQFIYIPEILIELRKYNEGAYESYYQTVQKTMEKLNTL